MRAHHSLAQPSHLKKAPDAPMSFDLSRKPDMAHDLVESMTHVSPGNHVNSFPSPGISIVYA
jgi:hypothetical protein